jgi:hypothetical protein
MIEAAQVSYTAAVYLNNGELLQTQYYADSFAAERVESVDCAALVDSAFWKRHVYAPWLSRNLFSSASMLRVAVALTKRVRCAQLKFSDCLDGRVDTPVDVRRLYDSSLGGEALGEHTPDPLVSWYPLVSKTFEDATESGYTPPDLSAVFLHVFHVLGDMAPESLVSKIIQRIHRSRIEAGTMPGTIAAQSLSQPITQMTLNTFHSAGKGNKTITHGVPRLREILDGTVNISTPTMTLRLTGLLKGSRVAAEELATSLTHRPLSPVVTQVNEYLTASALSRALSEENWLVLYLTEGVLRDELPSGSIGFRLVIDKPLATSFSISPLDIVTALESFFGKATAIIKVIAAPVCGDEWNVDVIITDPDSLVKTYVPRFSGVAETDRCISEFVHGIAIAVVEQVTVKGSALVNSAEAFEATYTDGRTGCHAKEWVVQTSGCDISHVVANESSVDPTKFMTNDVWIMAKTMGIEAVQATLYRECVKVLGDGVSPRHLMLVIDAMTFDGFVNSVNRHGMGRTRATPIQRASFEEALDVLMDACAFGNRTKIGGITECVVMGTPSSIGSGFCEIMSTPYSNVLDASYRLPFVGRLKKRTSSQLHTRTDRTINQGAAGDHVCGHTDGSNYKGRPGRVVELFGKKGPWRAAAHFEALTVELSASFDPFSDTIVIRAATTPGADRLFAMELLPRDHDDASTVILHASVRGEREKRQLVFNDKTCDTWGVEHSVVESFIGLENSPREEAFDVFLTTSERCSTFCWYSYGDDKVIHMKDVINRQDMTSLRYISFPSHDDYGNPMSWTIISVRELYKDDETTSSPIGSPVCSPVGSPVCSPVGSPVCSPVGSPVCSPVCSPVGSPVCFNPFMSRKYTPSSPEMG